MSDFVTIGNLTDLVAIGLSDELGFPHVHDDIAWSHFLAQHIGKQRTEQFIRSFYDPLNQLDKALNQLYTLRWLESAQGEQLDGCGNIVGITRNLPNQTFLPYFGFLSQVAGRAFGVARLRRRFEPWAESLVLDDTTYRTMIYLKIALNNGHGTAEEIMHAFNTSLGVTRTRIMDYGNANARVYINDFIMQNDPRSQLLEFMIPRAAGVQLWPYYVDADYTFGFQNQRIYYGFNIGILARRPGSNIPPIIIIVSIWDRGDSIWDAGQSVWDTKGLPDAE